MNKKQMSGFTLVELLAVIVILAIILVIAVPKVMDVIKDSKKATIESTAKMIAGSAEKAKLQNQILGNNKEINCEDIAKINDVDYESCSIEFDGNTAKVTLVGSGKFEGLNVCNGTKTNSSGVNISCSEVCDTNEVQEIHEYVHPYEVDNVSLCEKFFVEKIMGMNEANIICTGGMVEGIDFDSSIRMGLTSGIFTEEELENYAAYEVNDIPSCVSYVSTKLNSVGETEFAAAVEPLCNGQDVNGSDFNSGITTVIDMGLFTEEELIEANVLKVKVGSVIKPKEIEELKICVPEKTTKLSTYLTKIAKEENAKKIFKLEKTTATYNGRDYDAGIRYTGWYPANKVYFNCEEKDNNNIAYGEENYNYESSCEVWRIIGVFNTKSSINGNAVPRVKIINTESTFEALWDSSASDVNSGYGINQWGESKYSNGDPYEGADLMQLLNGYYIGKPNATCKYCNANNQETCEQTCTKESLTSANMKPLTTKAKSMIENAVWDTYAVKRPFDGKTSSIFSSTAYLEEKGISTQYIGISDNDNVERTTSWTGLVGLMSVSDITYADGWLYSNSDLNPWSIIPGAYSSQVCDVWKAVFMKAESDAASCQEDRVLASVYLKSDIQIIGGDGNTEPYKLK